MGRRRTPFPRSRVPLHRRLLLDRAALRRWAVVVVLALATTVGVARVVGGAEEARRRWGTTRPVLVTTGPVDGGAALAGAAAVEAWPEALVPADALARLPDGARADHQLVAGAPLTANDLAPSAEDEELRHLAVPVGAAGLPVAAGDEVDLWATFDPSLAGSGPSTRRVAAGARVVVPAPDTPSGAGAVVVVAVDPDEVATVIAATSTATVALVLTGR